MAAAKRFGSQKRVALPGSTKEAYPPFMASPRKTPTASFMVTVVVRPKEAIDARLLGKPGAVMSRAEYNRKHGADPASIKLVKSFAKEFGLTVEGPATGRRALHLSGPQTKMEAAFGVALRQHELDGTKYRVREGDICLPEELTGHVQAVLGLDNRPQAQPHFRVRKPHASDVSYTPVQVATLYGFPEGATATGQTIGLIELGGGYKAADISAYFKILGQKKPSVKAVLVDKGKNAPTTADSADGEVMLDIEVAGAVAPGAKIVVYFTPNTDQGFIDAISTAVHDTTHKPSVISISWGGPESSWTAQSVTALDAACQAAAALGVTITVASGDNGFGDGVGDGADHVDFPASSPHVLACGGTKLTGSGTTITSEVVWNETAANEGATGGGVSVLFPLPAWQKSAGVPPSSSVTGGRGVPDVAGDADPATGYTVRVDGQSGVYGGTSAVAPLWAGLIAVANAANGTPAGFINPVLYGSSAKPAFRDITEGNNGSFSAGPGWDACTGLGSPVGTGIVKLLAKAAAAAKKKKKIGKKTTGNGAGIKPVKSPAIPLKKGAVAKSQLRRKNLTEAV